MTPTWARAFRSPMRASLGRAAVAAGRALVRGRVTDAKRIVDGARAALTAPPTPRFDILATRHVGYLALIAQARARAHGLACRIYYDDEVYYDCGQPFLVLCPHVFASVPRQMVAYQLEQTISSRWFTPTYWARLHAATHVLDYAEANVPYLRAHGVASARLSYAPITTVPDFPTLARQAEPSLTWREAPPLDVLFYGDPHTPRRQRFLTQLRKVCDVRVVSAAFGAELYAQLAATRIVVNIHYYEGALLETTRLSEAMSLGAVVVSEAATDQAAHRLLDDAVAFTPLGDVDAMCAAVTTLLRDSEAYAARQAARAQLVDGDRRFEAALDRLFAPVAGAPAGSSPGLDATTSPVI